MDRYDPSVFDVDGLDRARAVILTPEGRSTTKGRWSTETPWLVDRIIAELGIDASSRVIDYGCGVGRIARELIGREACRVLGVDISASMRALAVQQVGPTDLFAVVSPEALDAFLARGRATAAVAIWTLQHCKTPGVDAKLIFDALAPGAGLFVLGQKRRAVPLAGGRWGDDGIDVDEVLDWAGFQIETSTALPREIFDKALVDAASWSIWRKPKEAA